MARAVIDNGTLPDEVLDELDRMDFYRHPPRTLADARRVMRVVGKATKATLAVPSEIDAVNRAKRRMDKARRRRNQVARGVRAPSATELTTGSRIAGWQVAPRRGNRGLSVHGLRKNPAC